VAEVFKLASLVHPFGPRSRAPDDHTKTECLHRQDTLATCSESTRKSATIGSVIDARAIRRRFETPTRNRGGPGLTELRQMFEIVLGQVLRVRFNRQRSPRRGRARPLPVVASAEPFKERERLAPDSAESAQVLGKVARGWGCGEASAARCRRGEHR